MKRGEKYEREKWRGGLKKGWTIKKKANRGLKDVYTIIYVYIYTSMNIDIYAYVYVSVGMSV